MALQIALAGNPNSGKTTMFNALTGSYQYVGNWPGVTVEKKEGKLKGHRRDVSIVDLPGIYSLSPYTMEEVVTRRFLVEERPDVIIDIVDASNLERNLYLTTQLLEVGIPVVVALNMMDIVKKRGDQVDIQKLSEELGCEIVETSASKEIGIKKAAEKAIEAAGKHRTRVNMDAYSTAVRQAIANIHEIVREKITPENSLWLSIKIFERDKEVMENLKAGDAVKHELEEIIADAEKQMDDDSESIMANERYQVIGKIIQRCLKRKTGEKLSVSDKIDKIVTNKWLALPIFFVIMWLIYYVSITTVGDLCIGYVETFFGWVGEGARALLLSLGAADWTVSLVADGIIGSLGGIFTFVPQLMILFLFLSLLEDSGYMARVAFIMDRIFRKFGLSGKSFIPMLIGTGCSIPAVMASRTIENESDRRMTIMLTPFIPCGAKLPVFAMFIALVFPHESWVGPSMYLIGICMVIISGILLKRTRAFKGEPAPFVMELPDYKLPRAKGVLIHMWEKAKSFVKKAGTVIFLACTLIWILQNFSWNFAYLAGENIDQSILAGIGNALRWLFVPLGFGGSWAPAAAALTGLIAKETVVSTFVAIGQATAIAFTPVTAFAYMIFTLLAAPCFAAIGAIRREMGNWKWTLRAILYQTGVAYIMALLVNLVGGLIFPGSAAQSIVLNPGLMEEAGGGEVIHGDIVLIVFGAVLVLAVVLMIAGKIRTVREAKNYANASHEMKM